MAVYTGHLGGITESVMQYNELSGPAFVTFMFFALLFAALCSKTPTRSTPPYRDRDYLHIQDLLNPEVRKHHLDFNAHLHDRFEGKRFVEVRGEPGTFVAFSYATCKEVMSDYASFSSNPFKDDRLVALNTMSKADHARVLKCVHKYYTQDAVQNLHGRVKEVIEKCTADLSAGKVDVVCWAKRIHMSGTLARLGLNLDWEAVDEIVKLNDAMVTLVAPLGGVGQRYSTLSRTWMLPFFSGLVRSIWPTLLMAWTLGLRCTWKIIRPDVTVLHPPPRPRMGLWWHPELLPLVPRYFLSLHRILQQDSDGPLSGIKQGISNGDISLAEALTLMVQLMVNMTSANALCSLVFRLATEKTAAKEVFADLPSLGDAFIQEVLRLDAPLQRNPRRCVQVGGTLKFLQRCIT
ncbi:unnamed protein product [Effrenium voratum]|nr:unnamed protein product [Effrenium voratum]